MEILQAFTYHYQNYQNEKNKNRYAKTNIKVLPTVFYPSSIIIHLLFYGIVFRSFIRVVFQKEGSVHKIEVDL